jgi:hypothetical protein
MQLAAEGIVPATEVPLCNLGNFGTARGLFQYGNRQ